MIAPIVADTGGLLRALACTADAKPSFPEYEEVLTSASLVIVPALVLAEVDYFLRGRRSVMRKLMAEIFDPETRYDYEPPIPPDMIRALELDARFKELNLGLVDGTVAAVAERRRVGISGLFGSVHVLHAHSRCCREREGERVRMGPHDSHGLRAAERREQ